MNLLNPPKNYIDYRCAVHGKEGSDFEDAKRKFYKGFECEEEIRHCFNWLYTARNEKTLPYEQIEIRENDGKKHGHVVRMMIYDIEYWREGGQIKQRKIYMANQGQLSHEASITKQVDRKMISAGDYPEEWDSVEQP